MSWEDQGRQNNGWFGNGTAPPRATPAKDTAEPIFNPGNLAARIDAIAYSAVAHMRHADRSRDSATFDRPRLDRLRTAMTAWAGASSLSAAAFAGRFADPSTSSTAIDKLRAAAEAARTATTHQDLAEASADLAGAMQEIGLQRWPGFLNDAAKRADADRPTRGTIMLAQATTPSTATDARPGGPAATPSGRYVADNPRQWLGRPSVGTGECVPLVEQATGAPRSMKWRPGVPVQGHTEIRPGTAIATFRSDGHYEGHAAIYLGQDAHGIQVIDQWNRRDPKDPRVTIKQMPPGERTLPLGDPRHAPVDLGESYMSSNRTLATYIAAVWLLAGLGASAAKADIGCPPTHNGKPLEDVELFDGAPSNKIEVRPEPGRFVVPYTPREDWDRYPPSTLGCTYHGSDEMVTVVLPRSIRVCKFTHGPQVKCR